MPPRTFFLASILGVLLVLTAFYVWGRSLWHPLYARVAGKRTVAAVVRKHKPLIKRRFANWRVLTDKQPISLLAFKQERRLDLYKRIKGQHVFVKSYPFTAFSGVLGPKLREGDRQIPEGIYHISYLNPNSSYHLSMKVSYPNAFDQKMGRRDRRKRLGGDIFIHGDAVTIGCIPIGDKPIEELFTVIASNGHRNTRVIIAPYDMRNVTSPPRVKGPSWLPTLYQTLKHALQPYPTPPTTPQQK